MNLEAFAAIAQEYPELKAIFDGIGEIKSKIEIANDDAEKTTTQANERYEDAKREYEASLKLAEARRDEAESHERELNTQLALIAAFCSILVKQKSEFREELERIGNACKDDSTETKIMELIERLEPPASEESEEEIPTLDDAV